MQTSLTVKDMAQEEETTGPMTDFSPETYRRAAREREAREREARRAAKRDGATLSVALTLREVRRLSDFLAGYLAAQHDPELRAVLTRLRMVR